MPQNTTQNWPTKQTTNSPVNSPKNRPPTAQTHPHKLHREFVRLGSLRFNFKNKMLAILPEIYTSGIWKKYATSIIEYAGKYGDIAKTTVIKRLRLEENLENLPHLKAAIKKAGVHKVAMIAKIATPETDKSLAEDVLNMSKMAVQSLSKELRAIKDGAASNPPRCKAVPIIKKLELDEESTFLFLKLKAKLGKNLSDKEFLKSLLEEREEQEFPAVAGATDQKNVTGDSHGAQRRDPVCSKSITVETFSEKQGGTNVSKTVSRHIPAAQKRQAIAQTKGKCAYPNCNKPYEILHHTDRYSESRNHDSILPVCKVHHEFAHNGIIKNETQPTNKWQMEVQKPPTMKISEADLLYRQYHLKSAG